MTVHESILAIIAELGPIAKAQRNNIQNYSFRGIDDIFNAINPLLSKHGVFFVPRVVQVESQERTNKNGTVMITRILTVEYDFFGKDGSKFTATVIGEAADSGDKCSNKAMSAACKYALIQVFCISTAEEKDGDTQSHEFKQPKREPDYTFNIKNVAACNKIKTYLAGVKTPDEYVGEILKRLDGKDGRTWKEVAEKYAAEVMSA